MTYEELANLIEINEVDDEKVAEIAESMKDGWNGPAVLYSASHNRAITGSHRISAARKLIDLDDCYEDTNCEMVDVDEYLEKYCEENDCTIDNIDCSNLRVVFGGTDIEEIARQNAEW